MYVLHAEGVERQALVDRQVTGSLATAGAKVDLRSVEDARREFDAALTEAPSVSKVSREEYRFRRALGVA